MNRDVEVEKQSEPVKINGIKSKSERFFDLYAARFGPLTDKDGLDEWRRMVDADGYDEQSMVEALNHISDKLGENLHSKKPRIPWVKGEYNKARDRSSRRSGGTSERFVCSSCAGTGYMVGIKIEKEFIDLNAMIRDERNIPQNIRNGQVRHMVCHCYKGSSKWIEHYKPDDGHEPHNQALAKELSRLCMPDIPDNLRYAEHLIRWGSVTLALSTVQHRVDSFYDLANLKILASDTAQKAATDAGNANKIAERNRSNEGKSKELYLKLLEYAKLKADFAKDMMAYSVKMNEAKTLDEAEKIKRIEAERSERKILIHPQIKMSQAEFIQFYDYGAK